MVFVFAADISRLYDQGVYESFYQKLPAWRRAKADRIKREDGKVQCVGAWALWQKVQEEFGLSVEPEVESEETFLALPYVNLSHSGKYVLCAVETDNENGTRGWSKCASDTRGCCNCVMEEPCNRVMVGCDIEKTGPLRLNLAKRNFCQEEYEHILSAGSEAEQTDLFYRYWVLKESFIKATREGIGRPMNSFCTVWKDGQTYMAKEAEAEQQESVRKSSESQDPVRKRGQQFYYKEYQLDEEYKVAVCATEDIFIDEINVFYF